MQIYQYPSCRNQSLLYLWKKNGSKMRDAKQVLMMHSVSGLVSQHIFDICCILMDQYKLEYEKGSGSFSVVFTALSIRTGNYVAIKCMTKKFESLEVVKKLREIQALKILSVHENIIKMIEALYDEPSGKLALVFELMDMNLYECLKNKKPLTFQKIKFYMFQVLKAIDFMHRKGIFHRDIKPQNILIKGNLVKLADLGSCKGKHFPVPYTDYISTRWYRAPECLMTSGYYNEKMDIWGFGCVLFELITKKPLFPGANELDQIHRIHNILGTPDKQLLDRFRTQASHMQINFEPNKKGVGFEKFLPPGCTHDLKDLLSKLLAYDPNDRISAEAALRHEYFAQFLGHSDNLSSVNKDFRSTFFTMKQPHVGHSKEKSEEAETESINKKKILSKNKNYGSKNNLQKNEEQGILPKIGGNSNLSHMMDAYKKTLYSKKFSNDVNFAAIQGRGR